MKYPHAMERVNLAMAVLAGVLVVIIAALSVAEAVVRSLGSPTIWTLDVSLYLLVWAAFLGSPYAFQELGHVSVDFVRQGVGNRFGELLRRVLAVLGYACTIGFIVILAWGSLMLFRVALVTGEMTFANVQIPIAWLYLAMVAGSVLMLATIVFIILDLIACSKKYL